MRSPGAAAALAALCIGAAVLRYGLAPIGGYDVFWHVATGDAMLERGSLLPRDVFSYIGGGAPWPYKDAGAAVALSLLHRWGGFEAIVVAKAAVFLGAVAALGVALIRYRAVPWAVAALLLSVFVEATAFRFTERPQAVALAGTAVAVLLLERHRAGRGSLAWLIPLTIVLANVHRGALVLPPIVLVYAIGTLVDARGAPPSAGARRALLVSVVGTSLSCFATPFGPAILTTSQLLLTDDASRGLIPEWHPTTLATALAASPATVAFALLGVVAMAARGRHQSARDLGLLLLGLALALRTVRFLPYLSLLGIVPVGAALGDVRLRWHGAAGQLLGVGGAAVASLLALGSALPEPQLGLQAGRFPEAAMAWARDAGVRGNPLNDFRFGGYVLFCCHPPYSVYVDGRNELVYPAEHVRRAASILTSPAALEQERRRYGFEWLLVPTAPEASAYAHLDLDPSWVLAFQSQAAAVYLWRDGRNADLAAHAAYRRLRAFDLRQSILDGIRSPKVEARRETLAEIRRMLREDPENHYAKLGIAMAAGDLRSRGDPPGP